MRIKHRNHEPTIDASTYVAPTAVLVGRVRVGPGGRIMYGAVLDSEGSRIEVGECSIVCENSVVRATSAGEVEHPVLIEEHVFIGPHATLLGCRIERCCYIATAATVLQGAKIRPGAVVAVGALVHANTVIPADFFVPPNAVAIGDPVEIYSADDKEALINAVMSVGFMRVAFKIDRKGKERAEICREATKVRSREFGHHFHDSIID